MRHIITNIRLTPLADGRIASTSTWTGYRHEGSGLSVSRPMAVGDYQDELCREANGGWGIHRRTIVIAFLHQELPDAATVSTRGRNVKAEKFELASKARSEEQFTWFP